MPKLIQQVKTFQRLKHTIVLAPGRYEFTVVHARFSGSCCHGRTVMRSPGVGVSIVRHIVVREGTCVRFFHYANTLLLTQATQRRNLTAAKRASIELYAAYALKVWLAGNLFSIIVFWDVSSMFTGSFCGRVSRCGTGVMWNYLNTIVVRIRIHLMKMLSVLLKRCSKAVLKNKRVLERILQ